MRIFLLWLFCLATSITQVTSECNEELNTLTSNCNGKCSSSSDYELCVIYEAKADNNYCYAVNGTSDDDLSTCHPPEDDGCQYQCFEDDTDADISVFLIPESLDSTDVSSGGAELRFTPHLSEKYIKGFGALKLRPNIETVQIQAGEKFGSASFGKASANVSFADGFLQDSPSVEVLLLFGIDFESQPFINLEKAKSTNLSTFACDDCHLKEAPTSIANVDQLTSLDLSYNKFVSFPKKFEDMKNLEELALNHNQLSSFEVELPKLKNLRLDNNNLRYIPSVIGNMSDMQELSLTGNPNIRFDVTQKMFNVLNNLVEFTIDSPKSKPSCDSPLKIKSKEFCIVSESEMQNAEGDNSGSTANSGASHGSSYKALYMLFIFAFML